MLGAVEGREHGMRDDVACDFTICRPPGMCWSGSPGARSRRSPPTAATPPPPSGCSTSRRTPPTWSKTPMPGPPSCGCTGSATTPSAEIASELAWMDALRAEAGVRTPRVLAATDGRRIVTVADEASGERRNCVRFEFLPGTEPVGDSVEHFAELGELTARMHRHARRWARPAGFTRFHWDYDAAFGTAGALGAVAGRDRRRPGGTRGAGAARRCPARPAGRVRHRPRPLRPDPRRHPAGQPARGRRRGSASSTSTTPGSAGTCTTRAPR